MQDDDWKLMTPLCVKSTRECIHYHVIDDLRQFHITNSFEWTMPNNVWSFFCPLKGKEMLEDTKGVIRIRKPRKDRQYNGQTQNSKKLHRKIKIEQSEHHSNPRLNLSAPERLAVPAPLVIPFVLLLNKNRQKIQIHM
jgi:hypothetical protein